MKRGGLGSMPKRTLLLLASKDRDETAQAILFLFLKIYDKKKYLIWYFDRTTELKWHEKRSILSLKRQYYIDQILRIS